MDYIFLGTIVGVKGLDGTLKVAAAEDIIPKPLSIVKIGYSLNFSENFTLLDYKVNTSKYNYLRLKEVDSIEIGKKFIEKGIFVSEKDILNPIDKQDYDEELNFKVIDINSGKIVGIAIAIVPNPGNDLILVETSKGQFYLPFVDAFVKRFDREEKKIQIELIDGLLD